MDQDQDDQESRIKQMKMENIDRLKLFPSFEVY